MIEEVKLRYRTESGVLVQSPVKLEYKGGRIWFVESPYALKSEIKAMSGAKWHGYQDPPIMQWSVDDCQRNRFQLDYMKYGDSVYAHFDQPVVKHTYTRPLMEHQKELADHFLTYHYGIMAAEMRAGKSLAVQEVMERSGLKHWYWIGPLRSLPNIQREFRKWNIDPSLNVEMFNYEALVRIMKEWGDRPIPQGLVVDESSRCKGPTSQRSQSVQDLADKIREKYGLAGYVILMSGTPGPKSPLDWHKQCLAGDTWVLTSDGPKQIQQICGMPTTLRVRGGDYATQGFYSTGTQDLYWLRTKEGYATEATKSHRFQKTTGEWVTLADLQCGDTLQLANDTDYSWAGDGSFGDGYLIGFTVGDGYVYWKDGGLQTTLPVYGAKRHLIHDMVRYIPIPVRVRGTDPLRICNRYVSSLVRKFGFDTSKQIPTAFEATASGDCLKGFIRGLFDADACVNGQKLRIEFTQVVADRVTTVQRMLTYFGIRATLRVNRRTANSKPSFIDGRRIDACDVAYCLFITGDDAVRFQERIGFGHRDKAQRLGERISARHRWKAHNYVTVETIEYSRTAETFDVEVPGIHCFAANGLLAHNCEIAWPGFLKEGSVKAMEQRLAYLTQHSYDAGVFNKRTGWRDDERKCNVCGEFAEHENHPDDHTFEPSKNEVAYLYERLKGLVIIKHLKDCVGLPTKTYRQIICKPSGSLLRAAEAISHAAPNAITVLTRLRELSDGFQYKEIQDGTTPCTNCKGGLISEWYDPDDEERCFKSVDMMDPEVVAKLQERQIPCSVCGGTQQMPRVVRTTKEIPCPKDKALKGLLDECEETGRIVIFAGFTGSVDRINNLCLKEGWDVVRCDGRGWLITTKDGTQVLDEEALDYWANMDHPRVAFVSHPESGGMSLTLRESRMVVFWSNSFKPEYRIQAEARIQSIGEDKPGLIIVDLFHLPTDSKVLSVIRENRKLELLTMGEISEAMEWKDVEGEFVIRESVN